MNSGIQLHANKTGGTFYMSTDNTVGSDYIYDQTYKSYKMKQKFEKDPKYNYFNAVMQMKRKLSSKEQVYKKVFQSKQNEEQQPKNADARGTFYSRVNQSMVQPEVGIVKIEKLKRNSFKLVKEQTPHDLLAVLKKQKNSSEVASMSRTVGIPERTGHRSHMSLYEKPNASQISFQMTTKARNNKSYVQFEVTQKPSQSPHNQTFYQPSNPKPRLEQIMHEYRKMNRHSHYSKSKRSTLPKQFIEKLYQTNKMFYSSNPKKRTSLY